MDANPNLQSAFIEAMKKCMGVVTQAAEMTGIARSTHYDWMTRDPQYKQQIDDLQMVKKDFIESKLMKLINDGDVAATIFAAKTQLKDRGYVERTELDNLHKIQLEIVRRDRLTERENGVHP